MRSAGGTGTLTQLVQLKFNKKPKAAKMNIKNK